MAKRKCGVTREMKNLFRPFSKELSFASSLPAIVWQFFFLVGPILVIGYYSLADNTAWLKVSLKHYRALLEPVYFRIIGRSLLLAMVTAVTGLLCAYPVAYFIALRAGRLKNTMLFLLTLPFWINFLIQIYAWYFLLERNGLINMLLLKIGLIREPVLSSNGLFAIFLVMLNCYLPFAIMPLYSTLEKIDLRLFEASADLGATPWQTFWHVTVPCSMPGIKTALLLVMIPAFGEFVIPMLVGGSKYMFVGSLISYYFLAARDNYAGAAFTCLSGIVLIAMLLVIGGVGRLYFWRKSQE